MIKNIVDQYIQDKFDPNEFQIEKTFFEGKMLVNKQGKRLCVVKSLARENGVIIMCEDGKEETYVMDMLDVRDGFGDHKWRRTTKKFMLKSTRWAQS